MSAIGKRRRKFIMLSIGLLVAGRATFAQNPIWSEHYGGSYNEGGFASAPTSDGGYFAVGSTYSYGSGDHDIYVLRLDSLGDTLWSRTFGGTLADFGRDIQVSSDSGCIVVGSTVSWGAGKEDLVILGISPSGYLQWSKTYGGPNSDEGWSVRKTGDGNLIVCGTTSSAGASYGDLWLLKLTTTGDSIWARTFGGPGGESGMSVRETSDGYIAVGATGSFGEGYSSIYTVKVDFAGDSVWAKALGGPKADFGYAVEVSNYGDYIIAGATGSYGQGYYDVYVLAVSPAGDVIWEKVYGGTKDDRAYAICNTPSGDFIVGGTTESSGQGAVDMYVLRLNPVGDLIWSRSLGGALSDYCRGITMDGKGNFILSGYSYSFATGGSDLYLLNLSGDAPTGVDELPSDGLPRGFALEQNYPNPFNNMTHIQFSLPHRAAVSLVLYNALGQEVRRWDEMTHGPGLFQLDWDGTDARGNDVASGIYLYSLVAADLKITKKMVLVK